VHDKIKVNVTCYLTLKTKHRIRMYIRSKLQRIWFTEHTEEILAENWKNE